MSEKQMYQIELSEDDVNIVCGLLTYGCNEFGRSIAEDPSIENLKIFKDIARVHNSIADQCNLSRKINITIIGV